MADEVETFTNRIIVDADQALTEVEKLRQSIDAYKAQLKQLATQTTESFNVLAESIKRSMVEAKKSALDELAKNGPLQGLTISESQRAITQQYTTDTKALTAAIRELKLEQKEAAQSGVVNIQAAIAATRDYRQQIDQLKTAIQQIAQQQNVSFKDAAQGLIASGSPIKATNQALQELGRSTTQTASTFQTLGKIGSYVFGVVLGISAIKILRDLVNWMQQATESGVQFAKAIFQLEVGVRALQRAGVEVTIQEVYKNLDVLREKFKVFTTKELIVGAAAFMNLIRDMGFTKDQIFSLQESIATLAVVNGRAMDDVQRTVALALSSGYTEGLQRLGVSINRVTIAEKAAELGWKKGYTALTEQQRAYATYLLILEKTAVYQDDLTKYYQTLPGQIDVSTKSVEEYKNKIGETTVFLSAIIARLKELWMRLTYLFSPTLILIRFMNDLVGLFVLFGDILAPVGSKVGQLGDATRNLGGAFVWAKGTAQNFFEYLVQKLDELEKKGGVLGKIAAYLKGIQGSEEGKGRAEMMGNTGVGGKTEAESAKDFVAELIGELEKSEQQFRDDSLNAWEDYQKDLAKINRDGLRRQVELWTDFSRKLAEIERDLQRDIAKENNDYAIDLGKIDTNEARANEEAYRDYNRDLADIDRDAVNRKAEAERDYRNREITEEEKFQEKMRKLREDFLMDLEDAVRERDARQIMRLIRNYNKERDQNVRDYELDKKERARSFVEELADIERQRQIKRQERAIELQEKLADIKRDAEYARQERAIEHQQELADLQAEADQKRADAAADYAQEQADLKADQAQKRADRLTGYNEQINDLKIANIERQREIAAGLAAEYSITGTMLNEIQKLMQAYYGSDGIYMRIISAFYAALGGYAGSISGVDPSKFGNQQGSSLGGASASGSVIPKKKSNYMGGFADGGAFLAKHTVTATFGEAGPEVVTAIPLNRANVTTDNPYGAPATSTGGSEKVEIVLYMSPDLQAKIINNTMKATANVLLSVQRAKTVKGI